MMQKVLRGVKRSVSDPRWFLYYVQRELTLNPGHRDRIANLVARMLPKNRSPERRAESSVLASELIDSGIAFPKDIVSANEVSDILSYLETRKCYDPRHPEMPGFSGPHNAHKTCFHAYYPDDDVVRAPHLTRIANHPVILEALEQVFGCKPTINSMLIWWLFSSYDYDDAEREQFLWNTAHMHRDIDDWLQIKLFIYLSDVDEETAPHMFVAESHKGGITVGKRLIALDTVHSRCSDKLQTVLGKAGTAWLENPFGMHVAKRPVAGNRLVASVSYSLLPLPFTVGRRPVQTESEPFAYDPYINRRWILQPKVAASAAR